MSTMEGSVEREWTSSSNGDGLWNGTANGPVVESSVVSFSSLDECVRKGVLPELLKLREARRESANLIDDYIIKGFIDTNRFEGVRVHELRHLVTLMDEQDGIIETFPDKSLSISNQRVFYQIEERNGRKRAEQDMMYGINKILDLHGDKIWNMDLVLDFFLPGAGAILEAVLKKCANLRRLSVEIVASRWGRLGRRSVTSEDLWISNVEFESFPVSLVSLHVMGPGSDLLRCALLKHCGNQIKYLSSDFMRAVVAKRRGASDFEKEYSLHNIGSLEALQFRSNYMPVALQVALSPKWALTSLSIMLDNVSFTLLNMRHIEFAIIQYAATLQYLGLTETMDDGVVTGDGPFAQSYLEKDKYQDLQNQVTFTCLTHLCISSSYTDITWFPGFVRKCPALELVDIIENVTEEDQQSIQALEKGIRQARQLFMDVHTVKTIKMSYLGDDEHEVTLSGSAVRGTQSKVAKGSMGLFYRKYNVSN